MVGLLVSTLLVAGAFLLRLYQDGAHEVWIDEALSFHRAITSGGWRPDIVRDPSPPLYYLALGWLIPLIGNDEASLRLLSVLCGTLFIPVAIWTGRELFNLRVGLWSGLFAAIAPIHIYYSQEARPYALLLLLLMLSMGLYWKALRTHSVPSWILASGTALLALFTHYLAVLALLPMTGLLLIGADGIMVRRRSRRMAWAVLVGGLIFAPWFWWAWIATPHSEAEVSWIRGWWNRTPPALAIPKTFEVLTLGSHADLPAAGVVKVFPHVVFSQPMRFVGLAAFTVLGVLVAMGRFDDRLSITDIWKLKLWLWAMLLFPLIALWLASLYKPVYALGRYDLVAFPALTLLVGLALTKLQQLPRYARLALIAVLLGLVVPIGLKLDQYYELAPTSNHRSSKAIAKFLASTVQNGDVVVFTGLRGISTLYYLNRLGFAWSGTQCVGEGDRRFGCRMFPREVERAPATQDTHRVLESADGIREDIDQFLGALALPTNALWIVFGRGKYADGELGLFQPDAAFVQELERKGWHINPWVSGITLGIFKALNAADSPSCLPAGDPLFLGGGGEGCEQIKGAFRIVVLEDE
jgi:4-amino-4-deoxy-L-arabinose transferase-like glycosyltransferase